MLPAGLAENGLWHRTELAPVSQMEEAVGPTKDLPYGVGMTACT